MVSYYTVFAPLKKIRTATDIVAGTIHLIFISTHCVEVTEKGVKIALSFIDFAYDSVVTTCDEVKNAC